MKVGILTYHNTANYGAALQAYATQEALTALGIEAEIIDYTNEHRKGLYSVQRRFIKQVGQFHLLQALKTLMGTPMILRRTKNFRAFYKSYLRTSSSVFRTMKSLKENSPVYDAYLVGSDQVWNYRNNGADVNYLLDFVSDKSKTISYASSFGVIAIPDELVEKYARPLSEIRSISVRENRGAVLVEKLTGRKADVVLDPVFLPEKSHWCGIARNIDMNDQPYMLLYTSKARYFSEFQEIVKFDQDKKKIVQIGTDLSIGDWFSRKNIIRSVIGPEHFLGSIMNADFVLTSSFHGAAFSLIMEKPFIVFLSGDEGRDSRIIELLSILDLLDRIFTPEMKTEEAFSNIDYQAVNRKISVLREKSMSFLRNAMQQISNN